MKATRILLFLSPLLWFAPGLIPVDASPGLMLLNDLYKGLLGKFPWNAIMAFLCYTYARQIGREAWPWVVGSLVFPFIAPFILGFMSPSYGSVAYEQHRSGVASPAARAAEGPFATRFPLLNGYLENLPKTAQAEPKAKMDLVKANFEFAVLLAPEKLDAFVAEATARQLTVWSRAEDSVVRVFGAGLVQAGLTDSTTLWLRGASPDRKVAVAIHKPDGSPTKYFEYYPTVG